MSVTCVITSITSDRLSFLFEHPEETASYVRNESSPRGLDLGKSWGAIHFVLTGQDPDDLEEPRLPEGTLLSGREIGEEDLGYGPPMGVSQSAVLAFATYLEAITPDDFAERVRALPSRALRLQGAPINDGHDDHGLQLFIQDYASLRSFISTIAADNLAAIIQFI